MKKFSDKIMPSKKVCHLTLLMLTGLIFSSCAKKAIPDASPKGISKFQLNGGAAISQPGVDDYNPQVLQQGDNFLVLVFASNRSCGTCTGHNLFIARSTTAYNNDGIFPAFENPTVMTIALTPLNYANPIAFAPVLSGNNIRIYLTNSGGTIQQTAVMTPGGSYDTTLSAITNTAGAANATVLGAEFTGATIYARQNGTVYSFAQNTANTPVAMATGQNATSVTSVDGSFTSRYDGFFSLVDGTIAAMSLYGNGGNLVSVNTAIAKARLSARYMSVLRGGGFQGGLMFISGVEAGGTTQDMYVVDGMTVWQMWQAINPKPPAAPEGGTAPVATTTADPAFSPVAGTYAAMLNLTITSTTASATICYTTNGVDPVCDATPACTTGTQYSTAVGLGYFTGTAKAIACKSGLTNSAIVLAAYVSDAIQPVAPGGFNTFVTAPGEIYLSWTAGSDNLTTTGNLVYEICQSLVNGGCNTFTATYTTATAALNRNVTGLAASTTYYYRARTRDEAGNVSGYTAQISGTTLAAPTVNAPTFSPVAGLFNSAQNVTISTTTGSATLCYTTDGSSPACDATPSCTTGSAYSAPVNIAATATLRAIGCRNGYSSSTVTSGTYTIDTTAPVISATAPATSAFVTNTLVSYTVDEACASGNVTWTRTGGTADGGSPHVRSLVGAELTSGAHNNITLTNNPTLVSGSVYSVAFNCTDAAGNAATTITNTSITYTATAGGSVWTGRTMPASGNWGSITYGNGMFVAVAGSSTIAATSPDGINWTARTLPASVNWVSVTYGNGIFVAIASSSATAATSPDGITWTARTLPSSVFWTSVSYGNGVFTAVAAGPSNTAATSPDGITWTARTLPSSADWYSVTYGNGVFAAVVLGSNQAATSADGITWTARTLPSSNSWYSVTYGNGIFVTVAGPSTAAATSPDGITWTARTLPSSSIWRSVTYGNGIFVAVAQSSTAAATSPDGITWTARTLSSSAIWRSVAYGNGMFAAVAAGPTVAATSSPNLDTTAPVISTVSPGSSTTVSNTKVSFTLSETCVSGNITWTRTGGTADPGSPRIQSLAGGELVLGAHNNITLTNNPALVSGSVYSVSFNCTDDSSNAATVVTSTNVTYDPTAAGWYTFLGGTSSDVGYSVQQTSDGGYIAAGYAGGNIATLGGQTTLNAYTASNDFLVVKLTSAGAVSWYTILGGTGVDTANSVKQTADGGYIIAGSAAANIATMGGQTPLISYGGGGSDCLLVKLTSAGAVSWYTFLGGTGSDSCASVQQTSDGGYITGGSSFFNIPSLGGQSPLNAWNASSDMLIVKLTSAGAVSWYTFLGSTSGDSAAAVYQTTDSGYFISGSAGANIATLGGQTPLNAYSASTDAFLIKLTSAGAVSWYTFLGGTGADLALSGQQTADGGYVVGGYAGSNIATLGGQTPLNTYTALNDFMVVKLTSAGAVSWYTFLGGTSNDYSYTLQQTSDGGYIVGGEASANIATLGGQTPIYSYSGAGTDGLMVKLSSGGTVSWYTFLGGGGTDVIRSIHQTSDGGYSVLGHAGANIATLGGKTPVNAFSANSELFFIKLKSDGSM